VSLGASLRWLRRIPSWKRLAELIEKEELTYEEALWLREIARRLIREYGTPETWKLHIYASIWVALARKKESQQ